MCFQLSKVKFDFDSLCYLIHRLRFAPSFRYLTLPANLYTKTDWYYQHYS